MLLAVKHLQDFTLFKHTVALRSTCTEGISLCLFLKKDISFWVLFSMLNKCLPEQNYPFTKIQNHSISRVLSLHIYPGCWKFDILQMLEQSYKISKAGSQNTVLLKGKEKETFTDVKSHLPFFFSFLPFLKTAWRQRCLINPLSITTCSSTFVFNIIRSLVSEMFIFIALPK